MDGYVTRAMEDHGEACSFGDAVYARAEKLYDLAATLSLAADHGDFTIPSGTDCAAFEARIDALCRDIENMLDGYAPGQERA